MTNGRTMTSAAAGVLAAALLLTASCTSGTPGAPGAPGGGAGEERAPTGPVARLAITPADGTEKVAPDTPVAVKVTGGRLDSVTVADAKGRQVKGTLAEDGTWRPRWTLRPSTTYTVRAAATGTDGEQVTGTATFTTLKPRRKLESGMAPLDGETVGVGMPVQLLLSQPVRSRRYRAAIERALEVRMSKPVEGAWSWVSDKEVQFRPREYWPTGQKVTVVAHLAGVRAGADLWGAKDRTLRFTVGPRHITKISAKTHRAVVTSNGKVVRTIPVSLGKPGDDSYSGIMIAQEKVADMIMDSATTGNPGEYRIPTKWNVRMTYSGTFFHAAPWSTDAQGNSNVSHGCVNASPENARWFYEFTNRGDIIEVTGTSRKLRFGNGPTPWAKSWSEWLAGSALGKPVNG
ncbi:lipoprotein-anchoring transpeptidase ErfK/SrfK [Thermocatellispora tengchongensis]|uniref:Lipoprotein-anchoring transpeptidase ErfK/SrfK n=1 Tax=Thermocatellispora tengchongensis TaxID=1073253 RepID=A0A840NZP7_9ACTN|nr:Ig-like domain-containing protein [Thermocatellispora tengchongensis]MBB5132958.1 lipoprotein-anchoring transpeptidase ErfK/SrfK [Thermocatellispora tengchongensis]